MWAAIAVLCGDTGLRYGLAERNPPGRGSRHPGWQSLGTWDTGGQGTGHGSSGVSAEGRTGDTRVDGAQAETGPNHLPRTAQKARQEAGSAGLEGEAEGEGADGL